MLLRRLFTRQCRKTSHRNDTIDILLSAFTEGKCFVLVSMCSWRHFPYTCAAASWLINE